jgi:predicted 2-oxoglutarate/Fe(II)-dependent dioxygenase YbiX
MPCAVAREPMPPPEFFRGFGVFVERGFLAEPDLTRVRAAVLHAPGTRGEISKGTRTIVDTSIRDVTDVQVSQRIASFVEARVWALRQRLETYIGRRVVPNLSVSFLRYGPNGRYRAHRDRADNQHTEAARRLVSVVLFLNDARSEVGFRGGQLRLYGLMGTGPHEQIGFDMDPEAGTLIAFDSRLLHEVVAISQGVRCAAVCWFLQEAGSEAD